MLYLGNYCWECACQVYTVCAVWAGLAELVKSMSISTKVFMYLQVDPKVAVPKKTKVSSQLRVTVWTFDRLLCIWFVFRRPACERGWCSWLIEQPTGVTQCYKQLYKSSFQPVLHTCEYVVGKGNLIPWKLFCG